MDLDQDPEHLTELLRESLKNLEGAREREAAIREEAQWLYAGLTELADSTSSMDVLIRLNELLARKLPHNHLLIGKPNADNTCLIVRYADDSAFHGFELPLGSTTKKVLRGKSYNCFNVRLLSEWRNLETWFLREVLSVLLVKIAYRDQVAVLMCTAPVVGSFNSDHLRLLDSASPLLANALVLAGRKEELQKRVDQKTAQLAESESRFRAFAEISTDWLWHTDEHLNIIYISDQLSEAGDAPSSTLVGKNLLVSLARIIELEGRNWTVFKMLVDSRKAVRNLAFRIQETERWVSINAEPQLDASGDFIGYMGTAADITEQKRIEAELVAAKEKAESSTEAKSEFLATISHEIRTPMNAVLGMLQLLLKGELANEQVRKVELAQRSAESLLKLINSLLDFSKIESGQLELEMLEFDLPTLLGDFAHTMAFKAHDLSVELILDIRQVQQAFVRGDPSRLRQILTNLVGNALKFTREGEIVITAALEMDDDGEQIFRCSVADTGIGIAEDKLETIFSSFCQADASTTRKFGGTGLGLSIVKQLCEHMGGEVSVTSTVGVGSCFSFYVKLEPAEVPRSQLPDIDIKNTKVLIIENNPISGEVLQGQLNCWGAKAELVKDVYIAEKFFFSTTSNSEELPFKILFIDNDVQDALEFAQSLRADQRYKELRLVIMTSIGNIGDATYYRSIGFDAYFTKPVTHGDLYSVLKVLIAGGEVLDRAVPLAQRHYLKELQSGESRSKPLGRRTWREGRRILLVEDNLINQELLISILREYGTCTK